MELFRYHIHISLFAMILMSNSFPTTRLCLAQETADKAARGVDGVKKTREKRSHSVVSSLNIVLEKATVLYSLWGIVGSVFDSTQRPDKSDCPISNVQDQDAASLHNLTEEKNTPTVPFLHRTETVIKEVASSKAQEQVSGTHKASSDPTVTMNTTVPFLHHTKKYIKNNTLSTLISSKPVVDDHMSTGEILPELHLSDNSLNKRTYPTTSPVSEIQDKSIPQTTSREHLTQTPAPKTLQQSTKISRSSIEKGTPEPELLAPITEQSPSYQMEKRAQENTRPPYEHRITEGRETTFHTGSDILHLTSTQTQNTQPPGLLTETHSAIISTTRASSRPKLEKDDAATLQTPPVMFFSSLSSNKSRYPSLNTISEIHDKRVNTTTRGTSTVNSISELHQVTRLNPNHIPSYSSTHTSIFASHSNNFPNNPRHFRHNAKTQSYSTVNKTVRKQPMLTTASKKAEMSLPKNVTRYHSFTSSLKTSMNITANVNKQKLAYITEQLLSGQTDPSTARPFIKEVTKKQMLPPDDLNITAPAMSERKQATLIPRNTDINSTTWSYILVNSTLKKPRLSPPSILYSTELYNSTQDVAQRSPKLQHPSSPPSSDSTSGLHTAASVSTGLTKLTEKLTESDIPASAAARSTLANIYAKHLMLIPVSRPTSTPVLIKNAKDAQNITHILTNVGENPTNVAGHHASRLLTTVPETSLGATLTANIQQQTLSSHSSPSTVRPVQKTASQKVVLIPGDLHITDQTMPQKVPLIPEDLHITDKTMPQKVPLIPGGLHITDQTMPQRVASILGDLHITDQTLPQRVASILGDLHITDQTLPQKVVLIPGDLHITDQTMPQRVTSIPGDVHITDQMLPQKVPLIPGDLHITDQTMPQRVASILGELHITDQTLPQKVPLIPGDLHITDQTMPQKVPLIPGDLHITDQTMPPGVASTLGDLHITDQTLPQKVPLIPGDLHITNQTMPQKVPLIPGDLHITDQTMPQKVPLIPGDLHITDQTMPQRVASSPGDLHITDQTLPQKVPLIPGDLHITDQTLPQKVPLIPGDLHITDQTLPQKKSIQPVLKGRNTDIMAITKENVPELKPKERNTTISNHKTATMDKGDVLAKWVTKQSHRHGSKSPRTPSASEKTSINQLAQKTDSEGDHLFSESTTSRPPPNSPNFPPKPSSKVTPNIKKATLKARQQPTTTSQKKHENTQSPTTKLTISEGIYEEASEMSLSPVLTVCVVVFLVMLTFTLWRKSQYHNRKNNIWVSGSPSLEGTYQSLL